MGLGKVIEALSIRTRATALEKAVPTIAEFGAKAEKAVSDAGRAFDMEQAFTRAAKIQTEISMYKTGAVPESVLVNMVNASSVPVETLLLNPNGLESAYDLTRAGYYSVEGLQTQVVENMIKPIMAERAVVQDHLGALAEQENKLLASISDALLEAPSGQEELYKTYTEALGGVHAEMKSLKDSLALFSDTEKVAKKTMGKLESLKGAIFGRNQMLSRLAVESSFAESLMRNPDIGAKEIVSNLSTYEAIISARKSVTRADALTWADTALKRFGETNHAMFDDISGMLQDLNTRGWLNPKKLPPPMRTRVGKFYYMQELSDGTADIFAESLATRSGNVAAYSTKRLTDLQDNPTDFVEFVGSMVRSELTPEDTDLIRLSFTTNDLPPGYKGQARSLIGDYLATQGMLDKNSKLHPVDYDRIAEMISAAAHNKTPFAVDVNLMSMFKRFTKKDPSKLSTGEIAEELKGIFGDMFIMGTKPETVEKRQMTLEAFLASFEQLRLKAEKLPAAADLEPAKARLAHFGEIIDEATNSINERIRSVFNGHNLEEPVTEEILALWEAKAAVLKMRQRLYKGLSEALDDPTKFFRTSGTELDQHVKEIMQSVVARAPRSKTKGVRVAKAEIDVAANMLLDALKGDAADKYMLKVIGNPDNADTIANRFLSEAIMTKAMRRSMLENSVGKSRFISITQAADTLVNANETALDLVIRDAEAAGFEIERVRLPIDADTAFKLTSRGVLSTGKRAAAFNPFVGREGTKIALEKVTARSKMRNAILQHNLDKLTESVTEDQFKLFFQGTQSGLVRDAIIVRQGNVKGLYYDFGALVQFINRVKNKDIQGSERANLSGLFDSLIEKALKSLRSKYPQMLGSKQRLERAVQTMRIVQETEAANREMLYYQQYSTIADDANMRKQLFGMIASANNPDASMTIQAGNYSKAIGRTREGQGNPSLVVREAAVKLGIIPSKGTIERTVGLSESKARRVFEEELIIELRRRMAYAEVSVTTDPAVQEAFTRGMAEVYDEAFENTLNKIPCL